jgi:hypothetical protein
MELHGLLLQWRQIGSSLPLQPRRSFEKFPCLLLARHAQMMGKTALEGLAQIFEQMPVLATWDIRLKKAPQMALSRSFSLQGDIGPRALLLLTVLLTALFWNGYPE